MNVTGPEGLVASIAFLAMWLRKGAVQPCRESHVGLTFSKAEVDAYLAEHRDALPQPVFPEVADP